MANETVTDGNSNSLLASPAFDIASLLKCAGTAIREIEENCREFGEEIHALQRTISVCEEMANRLGEVAADYDRTHRIRLQSQPHVSPTAIAGEAHHAH